MKKFLSVLLAILMLAVMLPVTAMAEENYVMISGITGVENEKYASFEAAYNAIKPKLEALCKSDALGQGGTTAEEFDALFYNRDENGNATLTYTICGNITYDESNLANLLTFGRRASHYGNDRHLINFKFVGAIGRDSDTLTVNSEMTLPYEWWSEKTTTSISFENLTITGSAPNGLRPTQAFFEGINFKVDNCKLEGIKIYNCSNVGGSYTITNNIFDGTNAPQDAYAIHLQGNETAPLTINISNNIISNYARGINIDQKTAEATIKNNTIKDLCGITKEGNTYGSAIQLTQGTSITVTDNTISTENVNALHFYKGLEADVTISNNNIKAPYLLWNEANLDQSKITSSGNTLDIANRDKAMTKTGAIDSTTTINGTVVEHPIVIITPTGDTPKTEPEKNPATGANDVVAAAVALMAVSALGMAVLTRKK